jgi:hypothetical protein
MTPDAEQKRRVGLLGRTFADTWRLWLERGAQIDWKAGLIHVPGYPDPIPLPWIRWDILLSLLVSDLNAIGIAVSGPVFTAPTLSLILPEEKFRYWFLNVYVPSFPPGEKPPEKDQAKAAHDEFPDIKHMRKLVRQVRPEKWSKPGPNRARKSPPRKS